MVLLLLEHHVVVYLGHGHAPGDRVVVQGLDVAVLVTALGGVGQFLVAAELVICAHGTNLKTWSLLVITTRFECIVDGIALWDDALCLLSVLVSFVAVAHCEHALLLALDGAGNMCLG